VPSFTFCATAEAVVLCGVTPVFVDVDAATFNVDRAAFPAQSFGGDIAGRRVGSLARLTTASFFPAKPFGCYGDGGAVFASDADMAATMRSLRVHGQGHHKYDNVRIGYNSRLDTVQAAILLAKLDVFEDELQRRDAVAARYSAALADVATVPFVGEGILSAWAQYTLTLGPGQRDAVAATLREAGVPTAIYYPLPVHRQTAYNAYPVAGGELTVSQDLSGRVLSLSMHPYLDEEIQNRIVVEVLGALERACVSDAGPPYTTRAGHDAHT